MNGRDLPAGLKRAGSSHGVRTEAKKDELRLAETKLRKMNAALSRALPVLDRAPTDPNGVYEEVNSELPVVWPKFRVERTKDNPLVNREIPQVKFVHESDGYHLKAHLVEDVEQRREAGLNSPVVQDLLPIVITAVRLVDKDNGNELLSYESGEELTYEYDDPTNGPGIDILLDKPLGDDVDRVLQAMQGNGSPVWRISMETAWTPKQHDSNDEEVMVVEVFERVPEIFDVVQPSVILEKPDKRLRHERRKPSRHRGAENRRNSETTRATGRRRFGAVLEHARRRGPETFVAEVDSPMISVLADGVQPIEPAEDDTKHNPPPAKRTSVENDVSATFHTDLRENAGIYAEVTGETSSLSNWRATDAGWFQVSSLDGVVYALPNSYRLAVDEESGLPAIEALLFEPEDAPGTVRTRLTLRAAPYFAPHALSTLRQQLRRESRGAMKFAEIAIGGYTAASFEPDLSLTGLGDVLEGEDGRTLASFDPASGFPIVYEGSAEFIRILYDKLTGAGLKGAVEVELEEPAAQEARTKVIPVNLHVDKMAPLDLHISADVTDPDDGSVNVKLENPCARDVVVQDLEVRALDEDVSTGRVVDWTKGHTQKEWPSSIAAHDSTTFLVYPNRGENFSRWLLTPVEAGPEQAGDELIMSVFDTVSSSANSWEIDITAPMLEAFDRLPEEHQETYADLLAMRVQVRRDESDSVEDARLTRDEPAASVGLSQSLLDLVNDSSVGSSSFEYRIQLQWLTHADDWGEWRSDNGTNLTVYPES